MPVNPDSPVPHPVPAQLAELIAERFSILGEPMRIRLLDCLRGGERTVQDLTAALETSQQNVSKHLGLLHRAGIVGRRKEGNHVYYSIADPTMFELCEQVCSGLARQLAELTELLSGGEEVPR
jgi:DNA-binding transcriptional ArsR family regulator